MNYEANPKERIKRVAVRFRHEKRRPKFANIQPVDRSRLGALLFFLFIVVLSFLQKSDTKLKVMKKYWIVIHKPTMKACYGLGMKTSKWDNEEKLKADMGINCWDNSDFVAVEITEGRVGK